MNRYLQMSTEVQSALKNGEPVVALESTILSHGMPSPENAAFALEIEQIVRGAGAVPATTAVIDGQLRAGLTRDELLYMCQTKENQIGKVSRRDLPTYAAIGRAGATTVSATMVIAKMAAPARVSTSPPTCKSWLTPMWRSSAPAPNRSSI